MKPKILALALACLGGSAFAVEPFVIESIRVEGVKRLEPAAVQSYLPVQVGETMDDERASQSVRLLFNTGFFDQVDVMRDGKTLVIQVEERPIIGKIEFTGMREFPEEEIKKSLRGVGLVESRVFDPAVLEGARNELKTQYFNRSKYAVDIRSEVTPLEQNRVGIRFVMSEGLAAKIKQINLLGNSEFPEKKLLSQFKQDTGGWFSWWTKSDQYARSKLTADLESLRSFYLNRGYMDFDIDSTQVSMSPDKKEIYITAHVQEGKPYQVTQIKWTGEMILSEAELSELLPQKTGETFSRDKISKGLQKISEKLGERGYAMAQVNVLPEANKEKHEVALNLVVEPGRRTYVRRIDITGNTRTRDEVVRREFRQMEGAWFDGAKLKRSRERVDNLGYFSEVQLDTKPVPGTTDQVDVQVRVTEKETGNFSLGGGYGQGQGFFITAGVTQRNVFGSGSDISLNVNTSKGNKSASLSFTDPYFTDDGISQGFDLYRRNQEPYSVSLGQWMTRTNGAKVRWGIPISESNRLGLYLGIERTKITLFDNSSQRYLDFVKNTPNPNTTLLGGFDWSQDFRDSLTWPTTGTFQSFSADFGLPGGNVKFMKLGYKYQWFSSLSDNLTLMLNGEAGYGRGLGGQALPFYNNYFAGGVDSVRGYRGSSLGLRDENGDPLGGNRRLVGNAELLFPLPNMENDRSVRLSAFTDVGQVYADNQKLDLARLRYSAGVAMTWVSPLGPLKFSFAYPLNAKTTDKKEVFQFSLGGVF